MEIGAKKRTNPVLAALAALVLVGAVASIFQSDDAPAPRVAPVAAPAGFDAARVRELAPSRVVDVVRQGKDPHVVRITMKQTATWSEATSVRDFAAHARDLLRRGRDAKAFPPGDTINVVLRVATVDRLGNDGTSDPLSLRVAGADLARINFDNFYGPDLLNLATPKIRNGMGAQLVAAYCADADNAGAADLFCSAQQVAAGD